MNYYEAFEKITNLLKNIKNGSNYTAIFDIDDTIINKNGGIFPIINLYRITRQKGIKVIFITARPGFINNIFATKQQLKDIGIDDYDSIYFLNVEEHLNVPRFKYMSRKNVVERGNNVLYSIGDMPWDIGEYGGIGFILNKF